MKAAGNGWALLVLALVAGGCFSSHTGTIAVPPSPPPSWTAFDTFCPDCEVVAFHDSQSGAYVTAIVTRSHWTECTFSAQEEAVWSEPWSAGGIKVCLSNDSRGAVLDGLRRELGELSDKNLRDLAPMLPPEGCAWLEAGSGPPASVRFAAAVCDDTQRARIEQLIRRTEALPTTPGVGYTTAWRVVEPIKSGDTIRSILRTARSPQRANKLGLTGLRLEYDVDGGPPGCTTRVIEISQNGVVTGMSGCR